MASSAPPPERPFSPPIGTQMYNLARSTSRSSLSPLRHRPINRAQTFSDSYPTLRPRRSSTFSDSAASLRSSTDDLLLPRAKGPKNVAEHEQEQSHWHSVPLGLALIPAVGGLMFENGGTVLTDLTLLGLAAVFLNWSVRLPWNWYLSAQAIAVADPEFEEAFSKSTNAIHEDRSEAGDSQPGTPITTDGKPPPNPSLKESPNLDNSYVHSTSTAAAELRLHELLALAACFISPIVGAWLLHHIRAQLSRPSEGLVSNYNLTIFLLAAELRPVSHLIKLVQSRTLHLQRVVATNPHESAGFCGSGITPERIHDLIQRVAELEAQSPVTAGAQEGANGRPVALQPQQMQQQHQELIMATRKTLQPDVDALNRAIRRYEKRVTLLTMQTDSRLQDLEGKISDSLALAAAAERSSTSAGHSQHRRHQAEGSLLAGSPVSTLLDWWSTAIILPMQVALSALILPGRMLLKLLDILESVLRANVIYKDPNTANRSSSSDQKHHSDSERRRRRAAAAASMGMSEKDGGSRERSRDRMHSYGYTPSHSASVKTNGSDASAKMLASKKIPNITTAAATAGANAPLSSPAVVGAASNTAAAR